MSDVTKKIRFDGEKLREERRRQGYRRMEDFRVMLVKYIPLASRQMIHKIENYNMSPGWEYLMAICCVLNVDPMFFYTTKTKTRKSHGKQIAESRGAT